MSSANIYPAVWANFFLNLECAVSNLGLAQKWDVLQWMFAHMCLLVAAVGISPSKCFPNANTKSIATTQESVNQCVWHEGTSRMHYQCTSTAPHLMCHLCPLHTFPPSMCFKCSVFVQHCFWGSLMEQKWNLAVVWWSSIHVRKIWIKQKEQGDQLLHVMYGFFLYMIFTDKTTFSCHFHPFSVSWTQNSKCMLMVETYCYIVVRLNILSFRLQIVIFPLEIHNHPA